jgi:hypothetical protein
MSTILPDEIDLVGTIIDREWYEEGNQTRVLLFLKFQKDVYCV